jgi:hypothetical protein
MGGVRACAALFLALTWPAIAFDRGQWGTDLELRQWFKGLTNPAGNSCCDTADGVRVEAPDWRKDADGTYAVFARGGWHTIDKTRIVTSTNQVGYAILWWPIYWAHPSCFLPGAEQ